MSTSAALGFCLSAAGTSFTDQKDESWGGEWAVWRLQNLWEQRQVTKVKVCRRCKSNLWLENSVVFLSLVCSAIKTKPRDKTKYLFKTTTNINTIQLSLDYYYIVQKAPLDQLSICERWLILCLSCLMQKGRISIYVRDWLKLIGILLKLWVCNKDDLMDRSRKKHRLLHTCLGYCNSV